MKAIGSEQANCVLSPAEIERAVGMLVAEAEVLHHDGRRYYVLAEVDDALMEALLIAGSGLEDMESSHDQENDLSDWEPEEGGGTEERYL